MRATVDLDQWRDQRRTHDPGSPFSQRIGRDACPRTPSPRRSVSTSFFPAPEDGRTTGATWWRPQRLGRGQVTARSTTRRSLISRSRVQHPGQQDLAQFGADPVQQPWRSSGAPSPARSRSSRPRHKSPRGGHEGVFHLPAAVSCCCSSSSAWRSGSDRPASRVAASAWSPVPSWSARVCRYGHRLP